MITDRAGWMAFDGTEVINSARLAAYLNSFGCLTGGPMTACPAPIW